MRIFLPQDTDFSSNGERAVNPFSCVEHRESTAWYVLAKFGLEDVDLIKQDYILIVETKEKGNQPFRIHNIEVGSYIHVTAHHIGYDTKHYAVELSTVLNGNANACLVELKTNIMPLVTPFVFSSNVTTLKSFSVIDVSLYEALTQIASEYNAYLDFDGWNVYILDSMGQDRGINIEYGKNLESATVVEDWELVVTKLKPIGNNGLTLTPEWLTADISYAKPYTKIMQFDTDSVENLALVAQLYLDRYKVPRINYSVKSSLASDGIATISVNTHGQLEAYTHEQLAEFTHAQLEYTSNSAYFGLGDTIYVKARQFTVLTDVISYDYNVLTKYVVGIEFGNYRPTVKNFFNEMLSNVEEKTAKRVQVKIDQLNGDFTIVANNYNNGLLSGTYYNFDGDAFTITNSLDEVVFSADVDGNLTLVGKVVIGSITLDNYSYGGVHDYDILKISGSRLMLAPDNNTDIVLFDIGDWEHLTTDRIFRILWNPSGTKQMTFKGDLAILPTIYPQMSIPADLGFNLSGLRYRYIYLENAPVVSSTRSKKDEVKEIETNLILDLKPVQYIRNDMEDKRLHFGFIAEDVYNLTNGLMAFSDEKTIVYEELIAQLVDTVQKQQKDIDLLKEQI